MGRRQVWDIQDALGELRELVQSYDSVEIPQGARIAQDLELARRAVAAYEATGAALPDANTSLRDSGNFGPARPGASAGAKSPRQR
jgi:hypothetical protein